MPVRIITQIDDGKRIAEIERKQPPVKLNLKEDWQAVKEAGDYALTYFADIEMLVLLCPFCGFEAPLPYLIKVDCKEPLNITQELYCRKCFTLFQIIKGMAHKSWVPMFDLMEQLKKCMT